ncbi:MAG TPA: response regulator transcription factor [Streptosporangiaceae bacterium]|jgi:DNA-binding NarL/FixJ family response regulator
MRLVLCDDNRILCEALAAGLEAYGHQVARIATTAADGIQAVAVHDPDVCLLDLRFCGAQDGLDAVAVIRKHHPRTKVLVLSAVTDPAVVTMALDAGAVGFLRKDESVGQIADALNVVGAGGLVIDASPRRARPRPAAARSENPVGKPLAELSPREIEVLHRIVAGQDTAQMVREMGVTTSTLQSYVKSVLAKLGAHSRLEAAALASKRGLLASLGPGRPRPPAGPASRPPRGS